MAAAFLNVNSRGFARELRRNRRALDRLKKSVRSRVIRKAVTQAIRPLAKDLKRAVPVDTKTLSKSIGQRVQTYRTSGVTVGVAGARRGFERTIRGQRKVPVRYAHMVERRYGTWTAVMSRHRSSSIRLLAMHLKVEIAKELAKGRR